MKANFPAQIFFSPDDKWFAVLDYIRFGTDAGLQLFSQDGSAPTMTTKDATLHTQFTKDSKFIVWTSHNDPRVIQVWSIPQRKIVRSFTMPGNTRLITLNGDDRTLLRTFTTEKPKLAALHELTSAGGDLRFVGDFNTEETKWYLVNRQSNVIAYQKTGGVYFRSIGELGIGPEKLLVKAEAKRGNFSFHPNGNFFVICDDKNTRIFSVIPETTIPVRVFPAIGEPWFDSIGRYLVISTASRLLRWDLTAPADAEPTSIQHPLGEGANSIAFDSHGRWMAVVWGESSSIQFYPLPKSEPLVFRGSGGGSFNVRFTPDGKSLINGFMNEGIRAFNISDEGKIRSGTIWKPSSGMTQPIDIDRSGKYLLVGTNGAQAFRISISDGKAVELKRGLPERIYDSVAFSPDGMSGAGVGIHGTAEQHGIEIWDFQSNSVRVIEQSKGKASFCVKYAPDGSLFSGDSSGNLYQWNLKDDSYKVWKVGNGIVTGIAITNDGRYVAASSLTAKKWSDVPAATSEVVLYDLKNNTRTPILSYGNRVFRVAFDPKGTKLVTGDLDGAVRAGPISGETPHLLIGHQNHIGDIVVDPTGKWIASAEYNKGVVRLWPMPEGKPLQTLSHQELMNRLRQLTNIRVIADMSSSTGYRTTMIPFAGWQEIPAFYLNR